MNTGKLVNLMPGKDVDSGGSKRYQKRLKYEILQMVGWMEENVDEDIAARIHWEDYGSFKCWVLLEWVRKSPPFMAFAFGSEEAARWAHDAFLKFAGKERRQELIPVHIDLDASAPLS